MKDNAYRTSERQLDFIKETINIGVGQAAASLNSLVDSHVDLSLPGIRIMSLEELAEDQAPLFRDKLSYVRLSFSGPFAGAAMIAFPTEDAVVLVSSLTGVESTSSGLDAVMAGALNEVGNIIINAVIGSISNLLNEELDFVMPEYVEGTLADVVVQDREDASFAAVVAYIDFRIDRLKVAGNIILVFELVSFNSFLSSVDRALRASEIIE